MQTSTIADKELFAKTYPATARVLRAYRWRRWWAEEGDLVYTIAFFVVFFGSFEMMFVVRKLGLVVPENHSVYTLVVSQIISALVTGLVSVVALDRFRTKNLRWITYARYTIPFFVRVWHSSGCLGRLPAMCGFDFDEGERVLSVCGIPQDRDWMEQPDLPAKDDFGAMPHEMTAMLNEIREKMHGGI